MNKNFEELFKIAYKKLKSSVYYDKTLVKLRADIVAFEDTIITRVSNNSDTKSDNEKIDEALLKLADSFCDLEKREHLINNILEEIKCLVFPKKYSYGDISADKSHNKKCIISNKPKQNTRVEECQYFIELKVEGHILSILWILLIGSFVDKNFSHHLYGNRIKRHNDDLFSFSPNLFEPYYFNFSSWRDSALDQAQKLLRENNDVLILTMDFSRFYYSLDIESNLLDEILDGVKEQSCKILDQDDNTTLLKSLNNFVFNVITLTFYVITTLKTGVLFQNNAL